MMWSSPLVVVFWVGVGLIVAGLVHWLLVWADEQEPQRPRREGGDDDRPWLGFWTF